MTRIDVPPRAGAISPPVAVLSRLRRFNAVMGALHAVQAVAVILLANTFALPITATYVSGPPGTTPGPVTVLAEVPLAAAVVAFLVVSFARPSSASSPFGNGSQRADVIPLDARYPAREPSCPTRRPVTTTPLLVLVPRRGCWVGRRC